MIDRMIILVLILIPFASAYYQNDSNYILNIEPNSYYQNDSNYIIFFKMGIIPIINVTSGAVIVEEGGGGGGGGGGRLYIPGFDFVIDRVYVTDLDNNMKRFTVNMNNIAEGDKAYLYYRSNFNAQANIEMKPNIKDYTFSAEIGKFNNGDDLYFYALVKRGTQTINTTEQHIVWDYIIIDKWEGYKFRTITITDLGYMLPISLFPFLALIKRKKKKKKS